MKEREGIIIGGVACVLLVAWLGFIVHTAPRFAGSGIGAVFGIAGAALMLVPLFYTVVKRIPWLHGRITPHLSLQSLLTVHVYAGILGPLFAVIHTGHKFDSLLGMLLTAVMLLVVISGFGVRYLLTYVNQEVKDKLLLLQTARGDLDHAWGTVETHPTDRGEVTRLAEAVADLEYAVRTHELFKRFFGRSLKLHILLSVLLYLLLALHIGTGTYFGLRWLR